MSDKSEEFKGALRQIFAAKGPEILQTPKQMQALLKDYAPKRSQETGWLIFALKENTGPKRLGNELVKAASQGPEEQRQCIEICERQLQSCMNAEVSHFVVHAIASALNFASADVQAEVPGQSNGAPPPQQSRKKIPPDVQREQSRPIQERYPEERAKREWRETAPVNELRERDTVPPRPRGESAERFGSQKKRRPWLLAAIPICALVLLLGALALRKEDEPLPAPPVVVAGTDEADDALPESKESTALVAAPVIPTNEDVESPPAAEPTEATFDFEGLVGTWLIRGAYIVVFEKDGSYYFNFVVSNGLHNHLEFPVPFSEENGEAVAVYSDDGFGNGGTVRISQEVGKFYISAAVDDRYLPQYDNQNNLSALIVDHEDLEYDKDILEYPIYKDYLDPKGFDTGVDLNFLKDKEYFQVADSKVTLHFTVLDPQSSVKFLLLDYDGDTIYEGTAEVTEVHKDYVILSGHDDADEKISIELECHYDNVCHLYTGDGKHEGTAFKKL